MTALNARSLLGGPKPWQTAGAAVRSVQKPGEVLLGPPDRRQSSQTNYRAATGRSIAERRHFPHRRHRCGEVAVEDHALPAFARLGLSVVHRRARLRAYQHQRGERSTFQITLEPRPPDGPLASAPADAIVWLVTRSRAGLAQARSAVRSLGWALVSYNHSWDRGTMDHLPAEFGPESCRIGGLPV
jgi:hypothetical protein